MTDREYMENKVRHAFNKGYDLGFKDGKEKAKSQQPCEDAISRQAVLDLIEHYNSDGLGSVFYGYEEGVKFADAVNKLPPVSTEKTGYWIKIKSYPLQMHDYECSECKHETDDNTEKYCSECGCRILGVKE